MKAIRIKGFHYPKKPRPDPINWPAHYTKGKIQPVDVIDDWQLDFYSGNVVKYIARAKYKGNEVQDLLKAQFYLNRRIKNLQK